MQDPQILLTLLLGLTSIYLGERDSKCLGLLFQQTQAQVSHELRIVKEARLSNQSFLSTWRLLTMELRVLSYFGSLMSKQCVEAGGLVWRIK